MRDVAVGLEEAMQSFSLSAPNRPVISTVTGDFIREDPKSLLIEQVTGCVRFFDALQRLGEVDLAVEVGVSTGLAGLAKGQGIECCATDMVCESVRPMLETLAIAFCKGATVNLRPFFQDRHTRTFELAPPHFLSNRCAIAIDSSNLPDIVAKAPVAPPFASRAADVPYAETRTSTADDLLDVVKRCTAIESGLAIDRLKDNDRLLSDLHLNSLSVNRIVARCCSHVGARPFPLASELSNATLAEVALCLDEHRACNERVAGRPERINGVREWIRPYQTQWRPTMLPEMSERPIRWDRSALDGTSSRNPDGDDLGLLIWLDGEWNEDLLIRVLEHIGNAARSRRYQHVAICHQGWPLSGMARSIAAENAFASVRILDRHGCTDYSELVKCWLGARIQGFSELRCAGSVELESPVFVPVELEMRPLRDLSPEDVVIAVGGARGIVAECAFAIASLSRSTLVLVGSSPATSAHVEETLARAKVAKLQCRYVQCDVRADEASVGKALHSALSDLSRPSVLLYGAGANQPCSIREMGSETAKQALSVKTRGLSTILRCIGPTLERLITFGSLISRIGLEGESHYALANAAQTRIAERFGEAQPGCSVLNVEWSVWGAIGMGERLGAVAQLARRGVDALSVDHALHVFQSMVDRGVAGTYSITGRFGIPAYVDLQPATLPCHRFIVRPLVYYPGVEIVLESDLSFDTDPYLRDHQIGNASVLPGALILEAFAQVARCMGVESPVICAEDVKFERAVDVSEHRPRKIRLGALITGAKCELALWCDDDDFREVFASAVMTSTSPHGAIAAAQGCDMDVPAANLYGPLFFGKGRFARASRLKKLTSRQVVAELTPLPARGNWFGAYEPQDVVLRDLGAIDAGLHVLQCCIPHRRLVPIGMDKAVIDCTRQPKTVVAIERNDPVDDVYVYDIAMLDDSGEVALAWYGARFRALEDLDIAQILRIRPELLRPFLERQARELGDSACRVGCVIGKLDRKSARRALAQMLDLPPYATRGDGKPISAIAGVHMSFSYTSGLALGIVGSKQIACDAELMAKDETAGVVPSFVSTWWSERETTRKLGELARDPVIGVSNDASPSKLLKRSFALPIGPHVSYTITVGLVNDRSNVSYPCH
jgi:enediyne polyketide synthase